MYRFVSGLLAGVASTFFHSLLISLWLVPGEDPITENQNFKKGYMLRSSLHIFCLSFYLTVASFSATVFVLFVIVPPLLTFWFVPEKPVKAAKTKVAAGEVVTSFLQGFKGLLSRTCYLLISVQSHSLIRLSFCFFWHT